MSQRRPHSTTVLLLSLAATALLAAAFARQLGAQAPAYEVNDSHLHLTNYIQEGTNIHWMFVPSWM